MYLTCIMSSGSVTVSLVSGGGKQKEQWWCAGLVLTLDDEGKLRLSYMGTDPAMNAVDIKHGAEVDFAALESEHREVAGQIKAVGVTAPAPPADDQLIITAQVNHLLTCVICSSGGCAWCQGLAKIINLKPCCAFSLPHAFCRNAAPCLPIICSSTVCCTSCYNQ